MFIYILKLEQGKYYIGRSNDPYPRIEAHKYQMADCAWTNKYKYESTIKVIETDDPFDEDKWVKKYMKQYGINNVRGGAYATIMLYSNTIKFIMKEIQSATDACYKCGSSQHFIKDCKKSIYSTNPCYKHNSNISSNEGIDEDDNKADREPQWSYKMIYKLFR